MCSGAAGRRKMFSRTPRKSVSGQSRLKVCSAGTRCPLGIDSAESGLGARQAAAAPVGSPSGTLLGYARPTPHMSNPTADPPSLILLPGMDGTAELFGDFASALPPEFKATVVRYPRDFFLPYCELLKLIQSTCSVSERFVIVAESYSTPLAILFAATNPPNPAGVVLCAGFATTPVKGWRRWVLSTVVPILFRFKIPEIAARSLLAGKDAPYSLVAKFGAAVRSVMPEVMAARIREVLKCDAQPELARVTAPILYIRATRDRVVSSSSFDEIRQVLPNVELAEIDAPHLLLQREPEKAAAIVAEFVNRL